MSKMEHKIDSVFDINNLRNVIERNLSCHNYETAVYWADKVMTLTNELCDVLVCANCLYNTGQYHRAISVIKSSTDFKNNPKCVLLIAKAHFACEEYEQTITVITDFLHPPERENPKPNTRRRSKPKIDEHLYSSIHLLLGKSYEAMGNYELASGEFKRSLHLDVYCYEAFDKLIGHHLLTASEEKSLLEQLPFTKQCSSNSDASLVNTLYAAQLKKYAGQKELVIPSELSALEGNSDLSVNIAERLYYNCHFGESLKITSKILEREPFHLKCLPLHIALLVELRKPHGTIINIIPYGRKISLFHNIEVSWFGVACYYHLIESNDLARQYFSKATSIDPLFGPAWLAFGHSFAAESEHDQAMAAYSRASLIMKGCHLPFLYIGLEYGLTSTTKLAEKFFLQALTIAPDDPFVVHELGVIEFQNGRYTEAEKHMRKALDMSDSLDLKSIVQTWEPLLNNMAHVCRKLRRYEEAIEYHKKALALIPRSASTFSSIGYCYMLLCEFDKAVEYFHKSLAVRKNDAFTSEMLKFAIEELVSGISLDIKASGGYEPLKVKEKLDYSLLHNDTTGDNSDLQCNESLPNTPRDAPHAPTIPPRPFPDNSSIMSVEMDMTTDDL